MVGYEFARKNTAVLALRPCDVTLHRRLAIRENQPFFVIWQ